MIAYRAYRVREVDGDRLADFVDLSGQAWSGFEGAYDTEIFGLFTATPTQRVVASLNEPWAG